MSERPAQGTLRSTVRLSVLTVCAFVTIAQPSMAQQTPKIMADTSSMVLFAAATAAGSCPNQNGILDSISVPVNQSINLRVLVGIAPSSDAQFQLRSENPAYVAAGDKRQGFLPIVTVPAGQTISNPFALFGVNVGSTALDIIPLSPGFFENSTPAGAWDLNQATGSALKFVDANPPANTCRDSGGAILSLNPSTLATCGAPVKGAATDGVTQVLLRAVAGLQGTACYEITSTSSLDQGTISAPVVSTQPVSSLQYGFGQYTVPSTYGDSSDSRNVTVKFTFTPSIGNGNTTSVSADLTLLRPPVMLMHGLWSSPSAWPSFFKRNDATHTTVTGDYKSTNASHFTTNVPKAKAAIDNALKQFRSGKNAGTQVDIVGHSMGGILARLYANSSQNIRPDNYNMGDVHRIITLSTPHFGSTLANLLISLHVTNAASLNVGIWAARGALTKGAICDLAENSPALQTLTGTSLQTAPLTASGGPFPRYMDSIENAVTFQYCNGWSLTIPPRCTSHAFFFPQDRVNAFRFQAANDTLVGLMDQQAGVTAGPDHPSLIPTTINGSSDVATEVFNLLQGSMGFAGSLPATPSNGRGNPNTVPGRGVAADQADYAAQCGPGGPLNGASQAGVTQAVVTQAMAATQGVQITVPTDRQVFAPGDTVTVNVNVDSSIPASDVFVNFEGIAFLGTTRLDLNNYQATQVVPTNFAGPLKIDSLAVDTLGGEYPGSSVTVAVSPSGPPLQVALAQNYYFIPPTADPQQLALTGAYSDQTSRDLTTAITGTTYVSNNQSAVTVSGDGLVTIKGPGIAAVTVANGPARDYAIFLIEEPTSPLPPLNLSSQFTISQSGYRLDRTTGFFVQTVTVTNTSNVPIPGALSLILVGLSSGVTLVNRTGDSQTAAPQSPYLDLPLSNDGRTSAPGQTTTFTFQFLNPNRVGIGYTPAIYWTSLAP